MNQAKKSWERLSDEEKYKAKNELITFFERSRNEKIGVIASEELLNFFLEHIGSKLYSKGVADARKTIDYRLDELKYDLEDLMD